MRPAPLPLLDTLVAKVRARRWQLLIGVVVGAAVGTTVFFAMPAKYVATSSVALAPKLSYLSLDPQEKKSSFVTLDTTAALVRSDPVVGAEAAAMQVSPEEARRRTTVTAQPLSTVLRIHVRGDTRKQARQGGHAAVKALVHERAQVFKLDSAQVRLLRKRIAIISADILSKARAGEDVTRSRQRLEQLSARLDAAVTSKRPGNLLLHQDEIKMQRSEQLPVLATAGLVAGALLSLLVAPVLAMPFRRRRRPSTGSGSQPRAQAPPSSEDEPVFAIHSTLAGTSSRI